jgi:hypothetical protein
MGDEGRELCGEVDSFTLKQGDLIYIPRGFVHAAECGDEASLHITLGVTASFLEDFLHAVIKAAIHNDERLRVALPLGFMHGSTKNIVNMASTVFRNLSDEKFLSAVMDQFRDELVKSFPLDVSGQVVDVLRPPVLTLETVAGPRRGIVYQMHVENDTVRLNFGTRSIVFPGFFQEPLEFALKTPAFSIRDIAGDLADEEKIVFIERLMQEGIVSIKSDVER